MPSRATTSWICYKKLGDFESMTMREIFYSGEEPGKEYDVHALPSRALKRNRRRDRPRRRDEAGPAAARRSSQAVRLPAQTRLPRVVVGPRPRGLPVEEAQHLTATKAPRLPSKETGPTSFQVVTDLPGPHLRHRDAGPRDVIAVVARLHRADEAPPVRVAGVAARRGIGAVGEGQGHRPGRGWTQGLLKWRRPASKSLADEGA